MGHTLTHDSQLKCPHGGTVEISARSADAIAVVAGAGVLHASEAATITGCPFTLPSGTSSPCTQVMWTPDARVRADDAPTLSTSSVGLCLAATGQPQGTVIVVSTQGRASTQ